MDDFEKLDVNKVAETPEFQALINDAVAKALAAQSQAASATVGMPDFLAAMKMLAQEIVGASKELVNSEKRQRGEPVPLSPAEEKSRGDARAAMGALIMKSRAEGAETPVYRVMAQMWLNENLIMPYQRVAKEADPQPVRIKWTGEPNLQMIPVNATAKAIYSQYLKSLGGSGGINEVLNQFGISLTNRPEQWISERGRLTTVAPSDSHRMMHHIEADPLDLSPFESPATGADDALAVMTADDPRQKEMQVLGTVHQKAQRGNFTDKVSLQNP